MRNKKVVRPFRSKSKPILKCVQKEPIVDTFVVAEDRLNSAVTYDQKVDGLKAAQVAIAEMNVSRLKDMLLLMSKVEGSMYKVIIDHPDDLDMLTRVYQIIHRSSTSANTQVSDTLKLMSTDKLAGLFLNPDTMPTEDKEHSAISTDCSAVLRALRVM